MATQMSGKVALVTGGSSGIGLAAVQAFAREGKRVVIASRTPETGERAASNIRDAGGTAVVRSAARRALKQLDGGTRRRNG